MSLPVLVFDIESMPDIAGLRALRGSPADSTDEQVYSGWCQERQDKGQGDFMPLYLQRVLVISCVFRNAEGLRVHSFVDRPVLHYRGLQRGVVDDQYWCMGEEGGTDAREFKWNNYISRYHMRHLD